MTTLRIKMNKARRHGGTKARSAFTLIEVIVAVAILAILMTMTVPRLVGRQERAFQLAADEVADLLIMYAHREALAQRPAGIWHDLDRNWLVLMILDIDEADPQEPADWRPDRFVRPVKLPGLISASGVSARLDGEPVDFVRWPIATEPGKDRASVEITLINDDGAVKTLVLPAHAIAPYQVAAASALAGFREPIDLDAAGRSREDW